MHRPSPETRADLVQVAKTVLATGLAWVLAVRLVGGEHAFLAPWVALLTVHATLYRSVWHGAQAVVAAGLGLAVSYAAVALLGYQLVAAPALLVAVLVGLLMARAFLARDEGINVATTAIFVITAGYAVQEGVLAERFLDTLVGVATGLVVNLVIAPPLDERITERALDDVSGQVGRLLVTIAGDLRGDVDQEATAGWIEATRDLDARLERARSHLSFARESRWANPLRHRSSRTGDPEAAREVLVRLEDGVAHTRAIARIVHESVGRREEWDVEFRRRWTDLLRRVGDRVIDPGRDAEDARPELERLVRDLSDEGLPARYWPLYGALLTALGNVAAIVDDVASRPVRTGAG
jgi:hypothetical protein